MGGGLWRDAFGGEISFLLGGRGGLSSAGALYGRCLGTGVTWNRAVESPILVLPGRKNKQQRFSLLRYTPQPFAQRLERYVKWAEETLNP